MKNRRGQDLGPAPSSSRVIPAGASVKKDVSIKDYANIAGIFCQFTGEFKKGREAGGQAYAAPLNIFPTQVSRGDISKALAMKNLAPMARPRFKVLSSKRE